jgi:thiamine kinase-like enzyme
VPSRTLTAADLQADPTLIADLLHRFHREMPHFAQGSVGFFWPFHVIRDYARQLTELQSNWASQCDHYLALGSALEAAQIPMPIIYGHHDTLAANLLQAPDKLWLIDYEYAGFGTAMFDLANTAGIARFNDKQSLTLLEAYLGTPPDATFLRAFDAMRCTAILREAMWSMVSQHYLKTPGVDFAAYATENLQALDVLTAQYETRYGKLRP